MSSGSNGSATDCVLYNSLDLARFVDLTCTELDGWSVWMTKDYTVLNSKDEPTVETFQQRS